MKRLISITAIGLVAASTIMAAPPGTIDGQNIPANYSSSRHVALQSNYSGIGDVTSLQSTPVLTEGSELDALYLAKDANYLYIGIAGNLLPVGSPFVVFIDSPGPFDLGQVELMTEGVGGPAFMVQLAGREVVVNDNGTPEDGSDDTYTVVPNSGTLLPNCNDPMFPGWDYALAFDVADDDRLYVHEYRLFGFQIGTADGGATCHFGNGRVSCDPTPDNPNDPPLPIFATRSQIAFTPINDGNEVIEGFTPGGPPRGGFNNTNTVGVTDSDASNAASATTGLEIAIPLVSIGNSPLNGTETINMVIVTLDGDEFQSTSVSDGYGTFVNQALPSLSGAECNPPASLGLRPDLSISASCFTLDLSTLSQIDPGAVLDGNIVATDYHTDAPLLVQSCPTSGGDQAQLPDVLTPAQPGSELDSLYVDHDDEFLYVGLTGNLEAENKSINIFIDDDARTGGGGGTISDFSNFAFTGTYDQWNSATFTSTATDFRIEATDFGGGFYDISPNANVAGANDLVVDVTVNAPNLAQGFGILLADEDVTERLYYFSVASCTVGVPCSLTVSLDDYVQEVNPGSTPGLNTSDLSFFHVNGGFESDGMPGVPFDMTFDRISLSDGDGGDHTLDFNPDASAFPVTVITGFGNTNVIGTYVSWDSATFTSNPTNFRVETTGGFGGGIFDVPQSNITDSTTIQLDLTVNPASSTSGTVLIVLADGDDSQLRYTWFNVPHGTQTLSANVSAGAVANIGGIPGFDYSNVSFIHVQTDYSTTDVTFDELRVVGVLPGLRPILGMNGVQLPNGPLDVLNSKVFQSDRSVEYDYAYGINLEYSPPQAFIDYFDLVNDTFAFRGAVSLDDGSSMLFDPVGGLTAENPNGLSMALDNTNVDGIVACTDDQFTCFTDSAATVEALAETAATGLELAIPLADLGISIADLPRVIHLTTLISDRGGPVANQSLPSMRNQVDGNQVLNPGESPVNLTEPVLGSGAVISDFSNFAPTGQYGTWTPADFTSGPDSFTVDATDFGGCFYIFPEPIDASGATDLVLDVTLNPTNFTDRIVAILYDGDGTVRVWVFTGLVPGHHVLTVPIANFTQEDAPGSVPGLDLSNLTQFNVAGAFHNGSPGAPMNVTFDRYELTAGIGRNFEARSARICLGTLTGDADCDGDNDLVDIALLQLCQGTSANPVFDMECEELDLLKDGTIDDSDFVAFEPLIDGPLE